MANKSGRTALGAAFAVLTAVAIPNGPALAFTAEQAALGKTVYDAQCSACHGRRLEGGEAPGLAGVDVMGNWDTAGGLYDFISVAMPPSEPGQLGEEAYLNIISYIMEVNGATADGKPLAAGDGLYEVSIAHLGANFSAAPAATTEAAAAAPADPDAVPQAFTWGKQLPGAAAPAGEAAEAPVPQAFTWGKQLPSVN